MSSKQEQNKQSAREFYDLVINQKDFEAARKYMGPRYKQHNPLVKDGPEGLKEFVGFLRDNFPEARSEIKAVFADGDYVIMHVLSYRSPTVKRAIIEILRFDNGKIDEHWDVIQPIPETSANPNGMF